MSVAGGNALSFSFTLLSVHVVFPRVNPTEWTLRSVSVVLPRVRLPGATPLSDSVVLPRFSPTALPPNCAKDRAATEDSDPRDPRLPDRTEILCQPLYSWRIGDSMLSARAWRMTASLHMGNGTVCYMPELRDVRLAVLMERRSSLAACCICAQRSLDGCWVRSHVPMPCRPYTLTISCTHAMRTLSYFVPGLVVRLYEVELHRPRCVRGYLPACPHCVEVGIELGGLNATASLASYCTLKLKTRESAWNSSATIKRYKPESTNTYI